MLRNNNLQAKEIIFKDNLNKFALASISKNFPIDLSCIEIFQRKRQVAVITGRLGK